MIYTLLMGEYAWLWVKKKRENIADSMMEFTDFMSKAGEVV